MIPTSTTRSEKSPRTLRVRWWLVRVACLGIVFFCQSANGQTPISREYKVKVAYLYKIALYVNQGDNVGLTENDVLVIGVLGPDPFGTTLNQIAKTRKIHSRKIVVKRFAKWSQYENCDLLFISRDADPQSVAKAKSASPSLNVLMVGESPLFEQTGGVFNLYLDDSGKVGIKTNVDAAQRKNFRIDARLLQVSDVVRDSDFGTTQSN